MTAEEILKRLLENFFVNFDGELEWSYIEGTTIRDLEGVEFEQALLPYLGEGTAAAYRANDPDKVD